jgi:hypothetical protein
MRFDEILSGLRDAVAFCDSVGLGNRARNGRFGVYTRRIQQLIKLLPRARTASLSPDESRNLKLEGDAYRVALGEGVEACDIFSYLMRERPAGFEPRMRIVLGGPELPSDEDPKSSSARNIQFEFLMMKALADVGYKPRLAEPDLRVEVLGRDFHIACKRVLSPAKIPTRLDEAAHQLRRSLRDSPATARGIIAISLSRILNPGGAAALMGHFAEAADALEHWLNQVAKALRPQVQRLLDRDFIVLVQLHASADFYTKEAGRLERGDCTIGRFNRSPFAPHGRALEELMRRLREYSDRSRKAFDDRSAV